MTAICEIKASCINNDLFINTVAAIKDCDKVSGRLKNALNNHKKDDFQLPLPIVQELNNEFFKNDSSYCFHDFIENFKIILPKPYIRPRNPELEVRIQKLKNKQDEVEYQKMVGNVKVQIQTKSEISDIRSEAKEIRNQLISVINLVVSALGTFAFIYKAIEYSSTEPDITKQVLGGILAATVVAIAELYFIAVYDLA